MLKEKIKKGMKTDGHILKNGIRNFVRALCFVLGEMFDT